ncbi:MAG TPA: amidohydrolase family protein [Rhodopila sp.]|uniref:amidohydrolase family protein n=1 Tax=Rhodopila sp. TaxID=2480087 RepID=UPI002BBDCCC5|nr:amidohydrolase family protein [Rhodopila sp.]HVY14165.1 amidohydrolase family protein [Rhodopila sp.]
MPADRVVVTGGLVLAAGAPDARPADIVLEGDTIVAIVAPHQAQAERTIDAGGRLIIPGLINAHTHGHGGLGKGIGDRLSLELLLNANNWIQGGRTGEDRYLSTLLSGIEMIRKGCTACIDLTSIMPVPSVEALEEVARAYDDLGMRAVIAPMLADRSFYQAIPGLMDEFPGELRPIAEAFRTATAEAALEPMRAAAKTWRHPRDRIRLGMAPTIPLHCSEALLTGCRDLAKEYGMVLQTHLAESPVQRTAAERRYGTTLTGHLATLGLIGPGFSGAHAVWLDQREMETIARLGGALAHNPGSNLRLGNGIADMRRAVAAGVTVGVGTDGSSSSDNQNMFEAMRLAAFLSRIYDRPAAEWFSAIEALALATEGSAAVLGMADIIGKIAPGYKADLVFLDLDHVNLVPLNNAPQHLVNAEDGAAVRDVMIGGRFVLKDRELPGIDWPSIAAKARAAASRLAEANAPARAAAERLAPVVDHFCVGLGRCAHHLPRRLMAM